MDIDNYDLSRILENLVEMTELVKSAMQRATSSLLTADIRIAESVISEDLAIDTINNTIELACLALLAKQELSETEVLTTVGCIRMSTTLERMGDLASHVAKQARLRYPNISVPSQLQPTFARMGELANKMVDCTGKTIRTQELSWALEMTTLDSEMDQIHRELFSAVLSETWTHGVEAAIDVTLLSRYYERFADHGLTIAKRVASVVRGEPYGIARLEELPDSE